MFEAVFTDEFEEGLFAEVEEGVGLGGKRFLEEHNQDWRGYNAIIQDEASKRHVTVDGLGRGTTVAAVVDHLREFEDEHELDSYTDFV